MFRIAWSRYLRSGTRRVQPVNARSIRARVAITLIVPLVAMAGLWAFTLSQTLGSALDLRNATAVGNQIGRPGDYVLGMLQNERRISEQYLATDGLNASVLRGPRTATDTAVADFRRLSSQYTADGPGSQATRARVQDALASLSRLSAIRTAVGSKTIAWDTAMDDYGQVISTVLHTLQAAAVISNATVDEQMHTLVDISQARELLSQEDALMTGAASAGQFEPGEYLRVVAITGALSFQLTTAGAQLSGEIADAYTSLLASPALSAMQAANDTILAGPISSGAVPFTLPVWRATFDAANRQLRDFLISSFESTLTEAGKTGTAALVRLCFAAAAGLLVIIVAVFISMRNGRSVVRRLTALRVAATELAHDRLPEIVARLRAGDQVDMGADVPDLPLGSDEIAQVGKAFDEVRRSAVESAVAEAAMRKGMYRVFVNISRRNQNLINRQLKLLGQMRTTVSTPQEQRNVALADHLAVRMRRHAEDLVILAGDTPSRGWHKRVPLEEVIRSAAAEVEDCDRIELQAITDTVLPGQVVPDVIHLLAELLENAATYSPPHTTVCVTAQRVPHGISVEIEDRGIGMTAQARAEANSRLAEPPDFDPADSARLGLFVVAQLAARRGLKVSLRPSSCDGITAVVLIPPALAEQANAQTRTPSGRTAADTPATAHHAFAGPKAEARWRFLEPRVTPEGADVLEAEVVDDPPRRGYGMVP